MNKSKERITSTGTALVINLDLLPTTGKPGRVLAAQVEQAGPDVRVVHAVVSTDSARERFLAAAHRMKINVHVPKQGSSSAELVAARVGNLKAGGRYAAVVRAPFASAAGRRRLLLVDLENLGLGASKHALRDVLAHAGPVAGAVAVTARPVSTAFAARCAGQGIDLVQVAPGPDAADVALVAIANERAARDGFDAFVVASCDHYFTRLSGPFDVVAPDNQPVAASLAAAASEVRTYCSR